MNDRLFPLDDVPEVPLLRVPRGSRGAQISDDRLAHDYPRAWSECPLCEGTGKVKEWVSGEFTRTCPECLGMGSVKARVRLEAGHRCVRCGHPFMTKGDAKMLGVEPSPGRWSPCDEHCTHSGPYRVMNLKQRENAPYWSDIPSDQALDVPVSNWLFDAKQAQYWAVEAEWRVLTVHHLDGDKANLAWWNLVALCQRCHLEIQGRVVMDRVYPHEHSTWFKPFVAGYYAKVYLDEDLTRDETMARLDELLDLERIST